MGVALLCDLLMTWYGREPPTTVIACTLYLQPDTEIELNFRQTSKDLIQNPPVDVPSQLSRSVILVDRAHCLVSRLEILAIKPAHLARRYSANLKSTHLVGRYSVLTLVGTELWRNWSGEELLPWLVDPVKKFSEGLEICPARPFQPPSKLLKSESEKKEFCLGEEGPH